MMSRPKSREPSSKMTAKSLTTGMSETVIKSSCSAGKLSLGLLYLRSWQMSSRCSTPRNHTYSCRPVNCENLNSLGSLACFALYLLFAYCRNMYAMTYPHSQLVLSPPQLYFETPRATTLHQFA
jgi:hypothetical protein